MLTEEEEERNRTDTRHSRRLQLCKKCRFPQKINKLIKILMLSASLAYFICVSLSMCSLTAKKSRAIKNDEVQNSVVIYWGITLHHLQVNVCCIYVEVATSKGTVLCGIGILIWVLKCKGDKWIRCRNLLKCEVLEPQIGFWLLTQSC